MYNTEYIGCTNIFAACLFTLAVFLGAAKTCTNTRPEEDSVIRPKWRKLGKRFLFMPHNYRPIRWRAYITHCMAQYEFILYFVLVLLFLLFTRSFDFMKSPFFILYPYLILLSEMCLDLGVWIYVKIKKRKIKSK